MSSRRSAGLGVRCRLYYTDAYTKPGAHSYGNRDTQALIHAHGNRSPYNTQVPVKQPYTNGQQYRAPRTAIR
jgi:hypothetical protein